MITADARHRAGAGRGPAGPAAGHRRLRGQRREPLTRDEAFLNVPARSTANRRGARPTPWTPSSTRPGTGIAISRRRRLTARSHDMVETWTPVEQYTGGAEHAVMHLLYAREFTKMMRDIGLVQQNEPWRRVFGKADPRNRRRAHVEVAWQHPDPDELVERYGADTVRLFLMFMGPWDQGGPRPERDRRRPPLPEPRLDDRDRSSRRRARRRGVRDAAGRLDRGGGPDGDPAVGPQDSSRDRRVRGVQVQHDGRPPHRAGEHADALPRDVGRRNARVGGGGRAAAADHCGAGRAAHRGARSRRQAAAGREWSSIHTAQWPEVDPTAVVDEIREVPIQVNGKLRDRVTVPVGISEIELERSCCHATASARRWAVGSRSRSSTPAAASWSTSSSAREG